MANEEDTDIDLQALLEKAPPSVRLNEPLVESYTFHSSEQDAPDDVDAEYILGIDEAGRGPVLGPQVYAAAYCRVEYEAELKAMGFADSKTLSHAQRDKLLDAMCSVPDDIRWAVRVMSPHDLSRGMLQRTPYNLNSQSHDATVMLIRDVISKGYRLTKVTVDTVGPTAAYQMKLEATFPTLTFVVESKADFKYPIVGAASIAAKVTRDACIAHWTYLESQSQAKGDRSFGSGYPGDVRTVVWLENNLHPVFGLPNMARFSWSTVKTLFDKRAHKVQWAEEPGSIQKYFQASKLPPRPALWKEMSLAPVSAF